MTKNFKTGFVTLIARPNVGKSTLLNKIAGQKIAITTPVAQTTRYQIKCIFTDDTSQIIFIDTPGVHKPLNKLGEFLADESKSSIEDSDVVLFLVDSKDEAGAGDGWIVENYLSALNKPVIIVANKIDTVSPIKLENNIISYKKLFEKNLPVIKISAKTGKNVQVLLEKIKEYLPLGEKLYPDDEITDQNMRAIVSEVIREKIILNTKDEIPHSVAVLVEDYKQTETIDRIKAQIIVSQESQKGIIIGKGGAMLKRIGTEARKEIEDIAQNKVFLELFVKVKKNWQKDNNALKALGFEKKI
ncbi:MAG: GTPase Era [Candidatus Gastranaerophilales bacterium]|nr:GTPase Era [Candidatus Gastranaerophilales bacterium]